MSEKQIFCTEVARIVSTIDEPRFAWPLIQTPLEPFLHPLIRSEFLVGNVLMMELAPDLMLPYLVSSSSLEHQVLAAGSPNCTPQQFAMLSSRRNERIDKALAGNPGLPRTVAATLVDRSPLLIASSEWCPVSMLHELGQSRNAKVRIAVAENSRCALEHAKAILRTCVSVRSDSIRRRVVECRACDREILAAVDGYTSRSGSAGSFDLWVAIARHADCSTDRRIEIFTSLVNQDEVFVQEYADSRYAVSDVRLDLLKLPECPPELQRQWLDALSRDRDDRCALEVLKLPICPPDLQARLSIRLQKSRSRFVQAALGEDRERAITELRRVAALGSERQPTPAAADPSASMDWAVIGQRALSGNLQAMREAVANRNCPDEIRTDVSRHVVERAFRTGDVSTLEAFNFRFARPFKEDKKCPVSLLRLTSTTDAKLIKRALASKRWMDRAALTFNDSLPVMAAQQLRNDEHEVVRGLALAQA